MAPNDGFNDAVRVYWGPVPLEVLNVWQIRKGSVSKIRVGNSEKYKARASDGRVPKFSCETRLRVTGSDASLSPEPRVQVQARVVSNTWTLCSPT